MLKAQESLKNLKSYINEQKESGFAHQRLKIYLDDIKEALIELEELKENKGITFKIEGDKLIGVLDPTQKRKFRQD